MLQPDVWYLSGGGLESMHLMIEDVKRIRVKSLGQKSLWILS